MDNDVRAAESDDAVAVELTRSGHVRENAAKEIIASFIYKTLPQIDQEALSALWNQMYALVTSDPAFGFLGYADYKGADDTKLIIYRFASLDGLRRWTNDPGHMAVKRRGSEFFEWIRTEISTVTSAHTWLPTRT